MTPLDYVDYAYTTLLLFRKPYLVCGVSGGSPCFISHHIGKGLLQHVLPHAAEIFGNDALLKFLSGSPTHILLTLFPYHMSHALSLYLIPFFDAIASGDCDYVDKVIAAAVRLQSPQLAATIVVAVAAAAATP